MGCEKIIVTFIKKQHTSEKWIEACTKSYLTLIKNKILWNYAQVWKLHFKLFSLSCLKRTQLPYIHITYQFMKIKTATC